jgi:threonylcarbamoyladenosine tRNA methylthiotransferase MtaB
MKTIAIATLGCKVNQFESEALMTGLVERGYRLIPFEEGADIAIINTCCVTHRADFESRQMVRKALRANAKSLVIVSGCYSQVDPEAFASMEGVHYLVGNKEKNQIPDLLARMVKGELSRIQVSDIQKERHFHDVPLYTFHHHTRAFLKIQDGCNGRCSYCIVPHARGPSRSLPPERVVEHLRTLKERGFKEVVLTGIHVGSYGVDLLPPFTLEKLLGRLGIEETPHRIRLSSIEPLDFSSDLISILSQSEKICPHLHIPIQSGDDDILKMMNRNYDHAFLSGLVKKLYERIDQVSIGADVIIGFPGETEERFHHTLRLIESLPLSYLHVFPFSRRKGTPAAQFRNRIDERTIKQRAEQMRGLGKGKRRSFFRRFLHQELKVLVEDRKKGGWRGFSQNYIPVHLVNGDHQDLTNQVCRAVVTEWNDQGVIGKVVEGLDG